MNTKQWSRVLANIVAIRYETYIVRDCLSSIELDNVLNQFKNTIISDGCNEEQLNRIQRKLYSMFI